MRTQAALHSLGYEDYLKLREGALVIEADRYGDKVLLLPDGSYIKLFRRKRLLSSAAFYPYVRRFADNVQALHARGIPCPDIIALYRIPHIERDAVHYRPLVGETLRRLLKQTPPPEAEACRLREQIGSFVARLHRLGVYFRSLHLGNIVLTPSGELGLIDVADMTTRQRALGYLLRKRNLKHLLRYPEETAWLCADGKFLTSYNHASGFKLSA
ncbi:toluene tolerance protein [Azoarcus sp. TTM-91]|uniref:lipopolysaccharide kinase InaA family protein n=1 Tax=Azoarcus sp. TTM-91 TaxID=2691581 RepID=UPI00145EC4D3|nr:lipopolysaccharide kinase InaA family protein [Azoarcus sp. TTM-91]NMG33893.1 toluene tolerance protein [Azoarcus sp. TTM-91]